MEEEEPGRLSLSEVTLEIDIAEEPSENWKDDQHENSFQGK
jgi:hypothetical protein